MSITCQYVQRTEVECAAPECCSYSIFGMVIRVSAEELRQLFDCRTESEGCFLSGSVTAQFLLEVTMLWTIFVILLVLWLLGLVSSYTLGGFIHILLVLALVVLVINLLSGRRSAV